MITNIGVRTIDGELFQCKVEGPLVGFERKEAFYDSDRELFRIEAIDGSLFIFPRECVVMIFAGDEEEGEEVDGEIVDIFGNKIDDSNEEETLE